jgi:hypothetical protein
MKHLGLDVSTSCTGVCLLNESGEIEKLGFIDLSKAKGLIAKANLFRDELVAWMPETDPDDLLVSVEEAAQAFRRGLSSAKTIATLNQFNGMVQLIASDLTQHDVMTVLPVVCRGASGIKVKPEKKCGVSTKEQVREAFERSTGIKLPNKELKSGPRKGKFVFDTRNYDAIDAWVVSRWSWLSKH